MDEWCYYMVVSIERVECFCRLERFFRGMGLWIIRDEVFLCSVRIVWHIME